MLPSFFTCPRSCFVQCPRLAEDDAYVVPRPGQTTHVCSRSRGTKTKAFSCARSVHVLCACMVTVYSMLVWPRVPPSSSEPRRRRGTANGYSGIHITSLPEETALYTLRSPCAGEKTANNTVLFVTTSLVAIQTTQVPLPYPDNQQHLDYCQQPPRAPE